MSAGSRLRVRAYAPYPGTGPSTRFRLLQFVEPLSERGIDVDIVPFLQEEDYRRLYEAGKRLAKAGLLLRGLWRRFRDLERAGEHDLAIVQRELAPVLNAALLGRVESTGVPFVYDFDDAVHLQPEGGDRLMRLLRRPEAATAGFCRSAARVLAGNRYLADFARSVRTGTTGRDARLEGLVEILPTVIDTTRFVPPAENGTKTSGDPVVGWIGTHTTARYLADLYPTLTRLIERTPFRLVVVSNRPPPPSPDGKLELEYRPWNGAREVEQVQNLDVGLYPLPDDSWSRGKCGFKAIQYLACGVPTVASPVGVLPEIVVPGKTGYLAVDSDEWVRSLERLLREPEHRRELGEKGREHVVEKYSVAAVVESLERALRSAAERSMAR